MCSWSSEGECRSQSKGDDVTALPQTECLALPVGANGSAVLFGRPTRRNAINGTMTREIGATLDRLRSGARGRVAS
jgi:hypothetical protein